MNNMLFQALLKNGIRIVSQTSVRLLSYSGSLTLHPVSSLACHMFEILHYLIEAIIYLLADAMLEILHYLIEAIIYLLDHQ